MAPRTPAQQKAYNAKRRAEAAAKRAPKTVVRAKPKNTSRAMREAKAKRAAKVKGEPQTMLVKAMKAAISRPAKRLPLTRETGEKVVDALRTVAALTKDKPAIAYKDAPVPTLQPGAPQTHTMARSYVRNGAPGLGKLRGKTYQVTTSFTPEQMSQVNAAAQFRGVSLAEMIRLCVVEHLNKGA